MVKTMQQTFSDLEYKGRSRQTRKEAFLEQMEAIIPWTEWVKVIEPYYYPDRTRYESSWVSTFAQRLDFF